MSAAQGPAGRAGPKPAKLERLKKRADFLRVAAARNKWVSPGIVVQARQRPPGDSSPRDCSTDKPIRVGFTTSRKVGNAVARNRARRRLRALAAQLLPRAGAPGHDYVLIGRRATVSRPFEALRGDLETALAKLARRARRQTISGKCQTMPGKQRT
jgi:ribonuclease P protein component